MKRLSGYILMLFLHISLLPAQTTNSLTVDDAVKMGLKNNFSVKISKAKVNSSEAKTEETNSGRLPSLKLNSSYTRLSEVDPFKIPGSNLQLSPSILNQYVLKLTASQILFAGNRLDASYDMSKYNSKAASEDFNRDFAQTILDIKTSYWNVYKAIEQKKSVDETIGQIQSHLNDVANMYKSGLATQNDMLKVQVQLNNAELMQIDADNAVSLSMYSLNSLIGLPLSNTIKPISIPDKDNPLIYMSLDELKKIGFEQRPELKAAEFRIKAGESSVSVTKAGWYPQIALAANYNYSRPNSRIFPSQDKFNGTWDIGINLNYDLWNWQTTSHQSAQAEAVLEQTKYMMNQAKDLVELDITQNYLNAAKTKEKIKTAEKAVLQAEENLRVTSDKFKNGLALNSDLIDAENSLLSAKITLASAVADFETAVARLNKSIGK